MIRHIYMEFKKDIRLPRFTMKKGEYWPVRPDRLQETGFTLGGGFVLYDDMVTVKVTTR